MGIVLIVVLLLAVGTADAHRMLLGYKVNELQLKAMYDDGTPAQGVEIEVYRDGMPVYNGTTDENGEFPFSPDGDLEALSFIGSSAGHRAELSLSPGDEKTKAEMPLAARIAAGLGYLLGLAGLSMIYVARKISHEP